MIERRCDCFGRLPSRRVALHYILGSSPLTHTHARNGNTRGAVQALKEHLKDEQHVNKLTEQMPEPKQITRTALQPLLADTPVTNAALDALLALHEDWVRCVASEIVLAGNDNDGQRHGDSPRTRPYDSNGDDTEPSRRRAIVPPHQVQQALTELGLSALATEAMASVPQAKKRTVIAQRKKMRKAPLSIDLAVEQERLLDEARKRALRHGPGPI
jgi:hypothetical protein